MYNFYLQLYPLNATFGEKKIFEEFAFLSRYLLVFDESKALFHVKVSQYTGTLRCQKNAKSTSYRVPQLKLYNSRSLFFHLIDNFLMSRIHFHILQTWKFYDISSFFDLRKVVFHKSDFFQKKFFSKIFFIFSKKFFFEIFSLQW